MTRRLAMIVVAAILFALALIVGHSNARAANWPLTQLDQIGSALSGKPVNVWCEDSWLPWESFWAQFGEDGTYVAGFTYPQTGSTLFLSPKICETLHAFFNNEDVGTYYTAQAILVLTHEATHQRLHSSDEALVECNALKSFPSVVTDYFHVPSTTTESYLANVIRKIRVGKKTRRVTVSVPRTRTVANPFYTRLVADAVRWDSAMPAAYHGATC